MKDGYNTVKNPAHYCEDRQYEPRKVIMDWGLNFYLGNAVKYISRAGRKGGPMAAIEDLEKARQYIDFEIERLEDQEAEDPFGFFDKEILGKLAKMAFDIGEGTKMKEGEQE